MDEFLKESGVMYQHGGSIALRPSQRPMCDCGGRVDGVTVFTGQRGLAQTFHYVVHQSRKMSSALLIAKLKVVEFSGALCSCQPIYD